MWRGSGDEVGAAVVEGVDGAGLGHAHPVLDLGNDLLDEVEVGRVGRQKREPCADAADRRADGARTMAAEIVEDNDVALPQRRHQELHDVGTEDRADDGSFDHAGLGERVDPEGCEERERVPAAVGGEAEELLAPGAAAADRGHVGLDPGLVDEEEPCRIEMAACPHPSRAPPYDVRTQLLSRKERFFKRPVLAAQEAPDGVVRDYDAALRPATPSGDAASGAASSRSAPVRTCDAVSGCTSCGRGRRRDTGLTHAFRPFHHRRGRDRVARGDRLAGLALRSRRGDAPAQIS